ncbi:hypothetical protein FQN49_002156 [Arthroderma sp. PD_2]|nr:hypothetical protein FQN49_002156 [Arthroderma sp. PD_2]
MVDRDRDISPKSYPTLAPLSTSLSSVSTPSRGGPAAHDYAAGEKTTPDDKRSPNSSRSGGPAPKISIKKESPSSPSMQAGTTRHRPRKLDLSSVATGQGPATARGPLTARDGLVMHDVGLACLSPGFQTQDPTMREQLQRSISVRDQQRSIIESRLQKSAKGDGPDAVKPSESNLFGSSGPKTSKKRPPPGLSIVAPSASTFANERVIQSAPLNQTFTGRRQPQPLTRHFVNPPSDFASSPQIHHTPATQTNNRLPPISDVFGADALAPRDRERDRDGNVRNGFNQHSQANNHGPLPSPSVAGNPPGSAMSTKRPREYRSAEEAVHELAGGREELLPRIVHYSGNRPNSPRSPLGIHGSSNGNAGDGPNAGHSSHHQQQPQHISGGPSNSQYPSQPSLGFPPFGARRRTRNEYEQDHGSPPLGSGPDSRYRPPPTSHGPFGAGRDSPDTQRRKKEEFLGLCARAWDLFHS